MLDAIAHAAGHGPHPGKYRPKPEDTKKGPTDTKPQESTESQCRETLEEFSKRVGLKYVRGKGSGVQLGAYPGGNLLPKKPKQPESTEEFCKRLGNTHEQEVGRGAVQSLP